MSARILLQGGIGSGKSTAARWWAERGAIAISTDDVARSVLAPGSDATAAVLAMWPEAGVDGRIDRERLGRIVFTDPAELAALETIVHPTTRRLVAEEVARHPDEPVVVEMPLLRDWWDDGWVRVVVDAPDEVRIERVVERDGSMTADDVRAVMQRQASRQDLLLQADYVLDNRGDLTAFERQCDELWETVIAP